MHRSFHPALDTAQVLNRAQTTTLRRRHLTETAAQDLHSQSKDLRNTNPYTACGSSTHSPSNKALV